MLRLSTSSPVPATSYSPPISPTITQVSSRSITPSLSETNVVDNASIPPVASSAISPPKAYSTQFLEERTVDLQSESPVATNDNVLTRDIRRPNMPPSSLSAPATVATKRILPLDASAYSNDHLPMSAWLQSKTSLSELAHLIRFQRLQERKMSQCRVRLHRWLVSSGLSARLLRCGDLAYRTLVNCFRDDDREAFATLHSAMNDVRSSCDATRRFALLESDVENSTNQSDIKPGKQHNISSFFQDVPENVKTELLAFISEIRTNPDFMASRLAALSPEELIKLAAFRPSVDDFSVMPFSKMQVKKVPAIPTVSPVERLLSFQRHDGLSALMFTVFANSSGSDSQEDIRRTISWATACARLMTENKPGSERLIHSVLDAYAGLRGWPWKHRLEVFLMQLLQAGQFLLEQPENSPARLSNIGEKPNKPLEYAADEYFELYTERLFALLDSEPSIGGLPEGALEIGQALLRKLHPSKQQRHKAEFYIVYRWFFCSFLPQALMYPETHGIMASYHISTYARERILRELATRMSHQAHGAWSNLKVRSSVSVMPDIKAHVDHLLERLRKPRGFFRPMLIPARAVASPKETLEVQPFLVLCPSDIKTLVYSLFPERKAGDASEQDIPRSGPMSSASSVSIPYRGNHVPGGDGSSILSQSVSSMTSEATTSHEPLLQQSEHSISTESLLANQYVMGTARPIATESYGRLLRAACSELAEVVGEATINGSCHPCADRWAVLHLSVDGKQIMTRMGKDMDDSEMEDDSFDSGSEADINLQESHLENEYHRLKTSIFKLLSEFELPKYLSDAVAFSHGKRLQRKRKQTKKLTPVNQDASAITYDTPQDSPTQRLPDLVTMLETALHQCKVREQFLEAHRWHQTLTQLRKISSPSLTRDGYAPLLHYFARGPRDSLSRCFGAIEEFDAWFIWLKQSQDRQDAQIEDMMLIYKDLRDKMWYKTEVVTSAIYDETKNVALALKTMGKHQKPSKKTAISKRTFPKTPATGLFLKSETQTLDVMAAASEHGGPNKLSDEQVDVTTRWLTQNNVEANYCKGEERIHRFCMELDKCVNKLVGDGFYDGPVLWSSTLYHRDRDLLDGGKSDLWLKGASLIKPAEGSAFDSSTARNLDFVTKKIPLVARTIASRQGPAARNTNSLSYQAASKTVNLMDETHDYFGISSPAFTIDSSRTFWSPLENTKSQQQDVPETSTRSLSTKASIAKQKSTSPNPNYKRQFMLDLKQTLTGLLLSDFGLALFNKGSETDRWFAGAYAEECMKRKAVDDKERLAHSAISTGQARAPSKASNTSGTHEEGMSLPTGQAPGLAELEDPSDPEAPQLIDSTPSDLTKKPMNAEFPFNNAYRMLLRRFAIHPNPFSKLQALHDLTLLIETSISSRTGKRKSPKDLETVLQPSTSVTTSGSKSGVSISHPSRARTLEEAIAKVAERRSHNMRSNSQAASSPRSASRAHGASSAGSDEIIHTLQRLFGELSVRKTLFRDLQYIAAFVPASTLDQTARGKSFWDASLAALSLKQDIVRYMVSMADKIVQDDSQARESRTQARQQPQEQQSEGPLAALDATAISGRPTAVSSTPKFKMADAAQMFLITAKEGHAAAERELAIFYLTQPDALPRTILPLSKPKEVFKDEHITRKRTGDDIRSDPATMCLAQHWMIQSRTGGDRLAADYLSQREDL